MNHVARYTSRISCIAALAAAMLLSRPALAQETGQEAKTSPAGKPQPAKIYDEKADANQQIAAAVAKAKHDNKRVLVMFGANWCGWCHKLHDVFKTNREIAKLLLYEYELVLVDIGRSNKHLDIVKRYGADIKNSGVPFLTVLDGDGKVLTNQETGALEEGDHHDPAKVSTFLKEHTAKPLDANKQLEAALARAAAEDKMVFLHFGAPWCGWCRRLEKFIARDEPRAFLENDFVDLKIDIDRMTAGKDVQTRFRNSPGGGIPWFAFLDKTGKVLATSDGPKGNVGFPVAKHEIAHMIDTLTQTARNNKPADIDKFKTALEENAKKLKQRRRG